MKKLIQLIRVILIIIAFTEASIAQEKVYRSMMLKSSGRLADGRPVPERPFSHLIKVNQQNKEQSAFGNINYNVNDYFIVYTKEQSDNQINEINQSIKQLSINQIKIQEEFDNKLQHLENQLNDSIVNGLNILSDRMVENEIIKGVKASIIRELKAEIKKVKEELQQQIDELKEHQGESK